MLRPGSHGQQREQRVPLIDTHVHILGFPSFDDLSEQIRTPRDVLQFRKRFPDLYNAGRREPAYDNSQHLLEQMDRYGVTHAVVQPTSGNTTNGFAAPWPQHALIAPGI